MTSRHVRKYLGAITILTTLMVVAAPLAAQIALTASPFIQPNYSAVSFGREISFLVDAGVSCRCESQIQLSQTTLVAKLPPGVRVVSATGPFSVSGSPQTDEQVTVTNLSSPFSELGQPLTVSIDNSIPDGTTLQASFEVSGNMSISPGFEAVRDSTGTMVSLTTFAFTPLFAPGGSLTITGARDPSFNGTFVILAATNDGSTQNLTYAQAGTPNASSSGTFTFLFGAGTATIAFQAGYLPVTVSVVGFSDLCQGSATLGTPITQ